MKMISKTMNSNVYVWNNEKVIKRVNKANEVEARNEIRILRILKQSPYVVDLDFTYENEHNVYMVLEYCKHGCMYDNHTILRESRLKQVLTSMLLCIMECHKNNIIHGDIKLTNFVVDSKQNTKLIDFGCSTRVASISEESECKQATWYYAAPENMQSKKYMQSDMWSLGVCAYVMATGKHPYEYEKKINIWNVKMDSENKYWKRLSTDCQDFIIRLLEFEYTSRMNCVDALYHPFIYY